MRGVCAFRILISHKTEGGVQEVYGLTGNRPELHLFELLGFECTRRVESGLFELEVAL